MLRGSKVGTYSMVAGVGFFIALPSRIVVFSRLCLLGSENSLLCGVSLRKKDTQSFLLAHPRPPPSVVEQFKIRSTDQKDKAVHLDCFIFLVAGVGFEPHGLRVMSPTSYQAALPRDIWCRKRELNPYDALASRDFKSRASADSATPANLSL